MKIIKSLNYHEEFNPSKMTRELVQKVAVKIVFSKNNTDPMTNIISLRPSLKLTLMSLPTPLKSLTPSLTHMLILFH